MKPKPIIIDISEWQQPEKIDYKLLAAAIDGVIVRVQYGSNHVDRHYQRHIREFQRYQIPVAVYAWVRGISKADMALEAKDFYQRAAAFSPVFWWLDVEEQSMTDMRAGCETYRRTLKELGAKKVGVYIANHLYQKFRIDTSQFDGIWLPAYGKNDGQYTGSNPTAGDYHLHQYTSVGRLAGYQGDLDLNRIVKGKFADFFGKFHSTNTKSLRFQLQTGVYLRKAPHTNATIIAALKIGDELLINNFYSGEGHLWGEQIRADGSVAYFALGEFNGYGVFI